MTTRFWVSLSQEAAETLALCATWGPAPPVPVLTMPANDKTNSPGLGFDVDLPGEERVEVSRVVESSPSHSLIKLWSIGQCLPAAQEQRWRARGWTPWLKCTKMWHQPEHQRGEHSSFQMMWWNGPLQEDEFLYANVHLYRDGTEEVYQRIPACDLRFLPGASSWTGTPWGRVPLLPTASSHPPVRAPVVQQQQQYGADGEDEDKEEEEEDDEGEVEEKNEEEGGYRNLDRGEEWSVELDY